MRPDCLIIDDSRVVRTIAQAFLEQLGLTCASVESGEEALEYCLSEMPKLILADWNLAGMSGVDLIATLRAQHGRSAIYMLTSTERRLAHIREAMRKGADGYILKPFDCPTLAHRLRRFGILGN